MALDQSSHIPLYAQLKEQLRLDIKNGVYKEGEKIPGEDELCDKYGVSRITVRRSIKELCNEDLLVKKQGKGTFILPKNRAVSIMKSQGFHDSMAELGKEAETEIVELKIINLYGDYAKELQIENGEETLYLKRVLKVDGKPMMLDVAYLPLSRFPNIENRVKESDSLYRLLRAEYDFLPRYYYKVLKLKKADKQMAALMGSEEGDFFFDLYKVTYNEEHKPLYLSISYSPWNDVSYIISGDEADLTAFSGFNWK